MERDLLIERGLLTADTDIDLLVRSGDEEALHSVWKTFNEIQMLRYRVLPGLEGRPDQVIAYDAVRTSLALMADVTALQALAANRRLVELLTGRRWMTMQSAREDGDSWAAIGDALGITKQGAIDWYKRKITDQEAYVPEFHDTARARAALGGAE